MLVNLIAILFVLNAVKSQEVDSNGDTSSNRNEDSKSSLVFVFDTTGSMHDDLVQLREGAELILNTALEESDVIEDFVFVPFHDPAVGPATVTRDKKTFKAALDAVKVWGGGDCPERSLGGIELALRESRPRSYLYVFTDATAVDHAIVGTVLDAVQKKRSQVVFVLTGHCNDLHKPSYQVYTRIAAASAGQVFNVTKTKVHYVLDFVRSSIKGRRVNLGSATNLTGHNYTQAIPVDSTLAEVTVSVSGAKPTIKVVNPSGEEITGPPKLLTTLDLDEIIVVTVYQPETGNWTITTGGEDNFSVKVAGLSNLTFEHGFSVSKPRSPDETTYRPLQGTYNYMMISLTTRNPVGMKYAEILTLDGKLLYEISLKEFDKEQQIYITDSFVPPDDLFYIAINGFDEYHQDLRRVGATAVQAKPPDLPFLTTPHKVVARLHETVVLRCKVESLVPVTAMWVRETTRLQPMTSSLQSTVKEYIILNMGEEDVDTYTCFARNSAGTSRANTEIELFVNPPELSVVPVNKTVQISASVTLSCTVVSEALLTKFVLLFNGTQFKNLTDVVIEPNSEFIYLFNYTITHIEQVHAGIYTFIAANRGGQASQSTLLTIQSKPTAQVLGPHTIARPIHSDIQLMCHVENADRLYWVSPHGNVLKSQEVNGSANDVLNFKGDEEGTWVCYACLGDRNVSDSVEITLLIKPIVTIENPKNVTIVNGTTYDVICKVVAKPAPRIIWHKETERFLNNTVSILEPNLYKSVLTLDSTKEPVNGTYFCFGENSQGIHQDSITVSLRRKMVVIEGLKDSPVQLYSNTQLACKIDAFPVPSIHWKHNDTEIKSNNRTLLSEDHSVIQFNNIEFDDLGKYACEVDNGFEKIKLDAKLYVVGLEPPALQKHPETQIVEKGTAAIITCRIIKGSPTPRITWQFKNITSEYFNSLEDGVLINDTSKFNIPYVDVSHDGVYRCIAENVLGPDIYELYLAVQFPPEFTNESKADSKPLEIEEGQKVTFSCKTSGYPLPIVVWTKDDSPIFYSRNTYLTDDTLVLENVSVYHAGKYTCTAKSVLGTAQKNFTLVVYELPHISPPDIEPKLEFLEGELVELPCSARGVPVPRVEWRHDDVVVASRRKYIDEYGLRFVANLTDFGEYTCIATNNYGSTSLSYKVFIWVAPYIDPPMDYSAHVLKGENATLQCDAVGFPIPNILWQFKNKVLDKNTTDLSFNNIGNLNVQNANAEHEGTYTCVAENVAGFIKKNIYLKVYEPPKILEDDNIDSYVATNKEQELAISCKTTGKPKPYVVWLKDDNTYIDKDNQHDIDTEGTLILKRPSEAMSGNYTCIAKNVIGDVNKTVQVIIYPHPMEMQADESQITMAVLEGTNASIDCPIHTSNTDIVKWYKDAKLVSQGKLLIPTIKRQNSSTYACVVNNAVGSTYTTVTINVEFPPEFPERGTDADETEYGIASERSESAKQVDRVKRDEVKIIEVVRGDDWYFDCGADAKPKAKLMWLFNSKPLLGEENNRLKLLNIQLRHTGTYKCIASNIHGNVVRQFTLDVLEPPFISDFDLLDVELKEGSNASIECNAKGYPAPEIIWTFNNSNWHQSNLTLMTTNITTDSQGIFRCDARNKAGASHLVYNVAVVSPAKVTEVVVFRQSGGDTIEDSVEIVLNSRVRLSCAASGKPEPTIQWIRNGNPLGNNTPGITYADLVLSDVKATDGGAYVCVVSNEGGNDERRINLVVLESPKIFQTLLLNSNTTSEVTDLEVISGQAFYLHCHPYGNPVPEIYWFRDGQPLRFYDETMTANEFGEVIVANTATYEQSGNYTCIARNKVGETSASYLVNVLVPPPTVKESVRQVSSRIGTPLTLSCPVSGSPIPNVMWVKHPYNEVNEHTPRIKIDNDKFLLEISAPLVSDGGQYSCVMTNKVGTTEVVFDVVILKPPSIDGNVGNNMTERHVVALDRSIVLKCQTDGNPAPKIHWLKDTQHLSNMSSNVHQVLGNSLLAVWSVGTRDAGQYICIVENAAGTAHRRYDVVVKVPGKWSPWSQWSYCNVTCGTGYQQRSRLCQYIDDNNVTYDKTTKADKIDVDESACRGSPNDRRKCHMPPCEEDVPAPLWSNWSKWSSCSASCGAGTQARTRRCRDKGACYGDNVQIRKCPALPKCSGATGETEDRINAEDEDSAGTGAYVPDVAFETHPEAVDAPEVEAVYVETESVPTPVYDVNVTENLDGSEKGPCQVGFRFSIASANTPRCDDIDECTLESNVCHSTQACVNTAGGYQCTCPKGFTSLGLGQRCLDINECDQERHGCEYACVNVAGGYVCACPRGSRLRPDRRGCKGETSYGKPFSHEEAETKQYMSTAIDFPARYTKSRN